jgi:hypothetical protein
MIKQPSNDNESSTEIIEEDMIVDNNLYDPFIENKNITKYKTCFILSVAAVVTTLVLIYYSPDTSKSNTNINTNDVNLSTIIFNSSFI